MNFSAIVLNKSVVLLDIVSSKLKKESIKATYHGIEVEISPDDTFCSVWERFDANWQSQEVLFLELTGGVNTRLKLAWAVAYLMDKPVEFKYESNMLRVEPRDDPQNVINYWRGRLSNT